MLVVFLCREKADIGWRENFLGWLYQTLLHLSKAVAPFAQVDAQFPTTFNCLVQSAFKLGQGKRLNRILVW